MTLVIVPPIIIDVDEDPEPTPPGGQACVHLPSPTNRWCDGCGALILAHEIRFCRNGHSLLIPPRANFAKLWCGECGWFSSLVA